MLIIFGEIKLLVVPLGFRENENKLTWSSLILIGEFAGPVTKKWKMQ